MLKGLIQTIGWGAIMMASSLMGVQMAVPMLLKYYPELPALLMKNAPIHLEYDHLAISWHTLMPVIELTNVAITVPDGKEHPILAAKVQAAFAPRIRLDKHRLTLFDAIKIDGGVLHLPRKINPDINLKTLSRLATSIQFNHFQLIMHGQQTPDARIELDANFTYDHHAWEVQLKSRSHLTSARMRGIWRQQNGPFAHIQIDGQGKVLLPEAWHQGQLTGYSQEHQLQAWVYAKPENGFKVVYNANAKGFSGQFSHYLIDFDKLDFIGQLGWAPEQVVIQIDDIKTEGLTFDKKPLGTLRPNQLIYQPNTKHISLYFKDIDADFLNPLLKSGHWKDKVAAWDILDGDFRDSVLTWSLQDSRSQFYSLDTRFESLDLKYKDTLIHQAVGKLHVQPDGAKVELSDASIEFAKPLVDNFSLLQGIAGTLYCRQDPQPLVWTPGVTASLGDFTVHSQGTVILDEHNPSIEAIVVMDPFSVQSVKSLKRENLLSEKLNTWFDKALLNGQFRDFQLWVNSPLNAVNENTHLVLQGQFEDLDIDYAPEWPGVKRGRGSLQLDEGNLYLWAEDGDLMGESIHGTTIGIIDIFHDAQLMLKTNIKSELLKGRNFIEHSPLHKRFKDTFNHLAFSGPMDMQLALLMPLKQAHENILIDANIRTEGANINVPEWSISINDATGDMRFTEASIEGQSLSGKLWGHPHRFSLSSRLLITDPWVEVTTLGRIDMQVLNAWLKLGTNDITVGETNYEATFRFGTNPVNKQGHLLLNTGLEGVKIDAPYPWGKEANSHTPLNVSLYFEPNELMRIKANYDEMADFALGFNTAGNRWSFLGGHLHFGENARAGFREDRYLLIDGELDYLGLDYWQPFLQKLTLLWPESFSPRYEIDAFLPVMDINVQRLLMFGQNYQDIRVEANWQPIPSILTAVFHGDQIDGKCEYKKDDVDGELNVNLNRLHLSTDTNALAKHLNNEPTLVPITIKIGKLKVDEKNFSDVAIKGLPAEHGYHFEYINAQVNGAKMNLFGDWYMNQPEHRVNLGGRFNVQNTTDMLKSLGMKGTIFGAHGEIVANVDWQGPIHKPLLNTLNGRAHIKLNDGIVQGVNPGFGKILSLLNLDNMHKRLNFDFSDLTGTGFSFDTLTTSLVFDEGRVRSNRIILDGPTAKIEGLGQMDLMSKNLQAELTVMPNVTGSLPLAAAIASANPAVGAAVWVVDKVFGRQIQEISRYRYTITGTWDAPRVQDTGRVARWDRK